MAAAHKGSEYRPEIDGLRGVAILAVLLNHTDSHALPGGYVGVDVFFVISGFLITSIVRRDLDAGDFSFWNFYARRAKRLIPAATVMTVATLVLGCLFFFPRELDCLAKSSVANAALLSNVFFWRQGSDYWAGQGAHWPLLHTWSLAVEEQYYLVYPLLLWAISGLSPRRQSYVLGSLLVGSFFLCLHQTVAYPRAAYYLLPGRAWELLVGAVCSFSGATPLSRGSRELLGLIGAALIGTPMVLFSDATAFPGWAATLPVTGTAILIWVTRGASSVWKTILRWGLLVSVGRISYSLYLFHWPLIVFAKYLWIDSPESPWRVPSYLAAATSIAAAWLSYRYVETPGRKSQVHDKTAVALACACCLVLLTVGFALHYREGLPERMPPMAAMYAQGRWDYNTRRKETDLPNLKITAGEFGRLGKNGPIEFVLWGDSHADALVPVVDHLARLNGLSGTAFTRSGTPPLIDIAQTSRIFDPEFAGAVLERLKKDRIPCVILAARWDGYHEYLLEHGSKVASRAGGLTLLSQSLSKTIAALRNSGVKRVWLVGQVPTHPCDVPKTLALHAWWGSFLPLPTPRGVAEDYWAKKAGDVDGLLKSCVAQDLAVIDMASAVFANENCLLTSEGRPMYFDDNHLSASGAISLAWALQPIFTQIAEDKHRASTP